MKIIIASIFVIVSTLLANDSKLRYVIDGDTVVFKAETCRLAYIDTPESKRNAKATRDVASCSDVTLDEIVQSGRYAKRYLKSIMVKGEGYHYDVYGKDKYGRSICVIYDKQGKSINKKIVENGFAVPFWKYIKSKQIKKSMQESMYNAQTNKKGIWRVHPNVLNCMNNATKATSSKVLDKVKNGLKSLYMDVIKEKGVVLD